MDESLAADASSCNGEKPRIKVQLYKTEPCQNWALHGTCRSFWSQAVRWPGWMRQRQSQHAVIIGGAGIASCRPYGQLCKFAHGVCEQRSRLRHPKYKTSLCKDFPLGKCTFGDRCNFAHSPNELRAGLSPQVAQASQPAQTLIQTPLTMLPDGRTISKFTPISGSDSPSKGNEVLKAAPLKSLRRVAGDLRRNQSMDTLRSGSRPPRGLKGKVSLASLQDISKVTLASIDSSPMSNPAVDVPSFASYRQLPLQASPPLASPLLSARRSTQQLSANVPAIPLPAPPVDSSKHQLYYLQQQEQHNIARRVASLSHLPTLKPSQSQSFGPSDSPIIASSNGQVHMQGFLLGGNQTSSPFVSHMHASPLAQIPANQNSPPLSSASYRDFEEAITPGPLFDSASTQHRSLTSSASMQTLPRFNVPINWDQPQQQQQQQQLLKPTQHRTLTSSASMQTLPRFKIPVNWDQQQHQTSGSLSSLSPSMSSTTNGTQLSMSSQNSAATLIDSDVWSSPSYANYSIDQQGSGSNAIKPYESRFFPAPNTASVSTELGSYFGARTHPHSQYQQQLRRQQSTDDWVSLRNTYAYSSSLASGGHNFDLSHAGRNASILSNSIDPRHGSVDQMHISAASARKQLNPSLNNSMLCL
ncbi:hypothetical protein GGF40_002634 [Coemansia sp. RSA 1286]|nr:hypothetical protein GGF40_002634 [Coemansia sp. RSA 1286]